jgi:prolyl-tRNA editing enzyme YbaK/EbsC (Cys-tRNA(Pro) deacylase)
MSETPPGSSAARVRSVLDAHGLADRVRELGEPTRTAEQAAAAVGCELGQIVKSLVFRARDSARAVMVVASGANRVDESKIAALLGERIGKADADFVREHTGFAIGGVAPLGQPDPLVTYIDEDLLAHERIWAAAGTPNALFELTPGELQRLSGGQVADVKA